MSRLARPADRLAAGSRIVGRRLAARAAAWCARARRDDLTGWRAVLGILLRVLLLAFGTYLLARIVRAVPALMWALSAGWTVAAWRAGKTPARPSDDKAPEEPPRHAPDDVRAATVEWIWQRIGDTQGVHLRDLLAHAHAHGMFEDLDVATFRTHLERWGIPVRARVRVRGLGVTVGIHRDDLTPPPSPSPADAPVEAA
ncbi:hypothetical protein [Streptomyces broussonetiae]|uniref:Uncharacterized protein n=1 Tax=Streptomyces broussonetiae TaxID=2686304 RepID=A0ABV5E5I6_9ACTN